MNYSTFGFVASIAFIAYMPTRVKTSSTIFSKTWLDVYKPTGHELCVFMFNPTLVLNEWPDTTQHVVEVPSSSPVKLVHFCSVCFVGLFTPFFLLFGHQMLISLSLMYTTLAHCQQSSLNKQVLERQEGNRKTFEVYRRNTTARKLRRFASD